LAHSLALATLGATCVLIILGGLVTNTGAALAVPDWPSTFGYNMMLFPWSSATVQNRAVTTRIVEYIGFPTQ
jgi:cytochrome c oxidase assembly protein subunit 15